MLFWSTLGIFFLEHCRNPCCFLQIHLERLFFLILHFIAKLINFVLFSPSWIPSWNSTEKLFIRFSATQTNRLVSCVRAWLRNRFLQRGFLKCKLSVTILDMNASAILFSPLPPFLRYQHNPEILMLIWKLPLSVRIFLVLISRFSSSCFVQSDIPNVDDTKGMARILCATALFRE